jgi:hypothetical protein
MRNNSTVARAIAASLVLGASAFTATASLAGGDEQYGLIHVNYPACMENPGDPSCQKPQGATPQSHGSKAATHEHHNRGG